MRTGAQDSLIVRLGTTEWFKLEKSLFAYVKGVPGVKWDGPGGRPVVHRSHLPLLPDHVRREISLPAGRLYASPLALEPRAHQITGAEFLVSRRGALLADTMRLGKTYTSLLATKHFPLLVVAPLQAREVWREWLERCFTEKSKIVLRGRERDVDPPREEILFVHYEILPWRLDLQHYRPGTLILDEAHVLSNERAHTTQSMLALAGRAQQVFALTGTPLTARPAGLYPILQACCPGSFGSFWDFAFRHCDARPNAYGIEAKGSSHEEELKSRLSEVMLRREWKDVAKDLPPITRTIHVAPVGLHDEAKVDLVVEETLQGVRAGRGIAALGKYRRIIADFKIADVVKLVKQYPGEAVVVWCWHRGVADRLGKELATPWVVHGGVSQRERDTRIKLWKTHTLPLVITLAVGQTAIDLSHSKRAIFAELDFTPRVISQAEMRTYSPLRPMSVDFVACDHEVDRKIARAVREKLDLADRIGVPAAESALEVVGAAFGEGVEGNFEDLERAIMEEG